MNATSEVALPAGPYVSPAQQLTFAGLVRGELVKLFSVRSLVGLLVMTVLVTAGIGIAAGVNTDVAAGESATGVLPAFTNTTLLGLQLSIFLVAVTGAVAGAADFGNGTIRVLLGAAPRRLPVLAAKLAAIGGAIGILVGAAIMLTAAVNWIALTPGPLLTPITDVHSALTLVGAVIAVTCVSISGVSLGCLLRSRPGQSSPFWA